MAGSPPTSPFGGLQRPTSALIRSPRSTSRMSVGSRQGGGSRASDEDGRASVKVGMYACGGDTRGRRGYPLIEFFFFGNGQLSEFGRL